jgi:hypothetical protein
MPWPWLRLPWKRAPLLSEPDLVIQLEGRAERLSEFATWLKRVEGALSSRSWARRLAGGPEAALLNQVGERWAEAAETLVEARQRSVLADRPPRAVLRWLAAVEARMRAVEARAHERCGSGGGGPAAEALRAVAVRAVQLTTSGPSQTGQQAPRPPGGKPLKSRRSEDVGCVVFVLFLAAPLVFFAVAAAWAWVITSYRWAWELGDGFNTSVILLTTAAALVGAGWFALHIDRRR